MIMANCSIHFISDDHGMFKRRLVASESLKSRDCEMDNVPDLDILLTNLHLFVSIQGTSLSRLGETCSYTSIYTTDTTFGRRAQHV